MRSPRQMFCACVLLCARMKNRERKKNGGAEVKLPTSGELVALALQVEHEDLAADVDTTPEKASARVKSWDDTRGEVLKGLVPFLEKFLTAPREGSTSTKDQGQGQLQPRSR